MKIIAFSIISSVAALLLLNGCDSECCQDVTDKIAPTPIITYNGQKLSDTLTCDNAKVQTITLTAASTDSDGQVTQNIWYEDNNPVQNGIIQCPPAGQSKRVCLTAVDDDQLENQTCITVTGIDSTPPAPSLKPPVAIIEEGASTGDGIYMDCSKVHDQDQIDSDGVPNPYGTDHAIKEVTWKYTYYEADGTVQEGPNVKTQTEYNDAAGQPTGTCKKWFHTDSGVAKITFEVTVEDDDNQTTTGSYTYDVDSDTLTQS